jgi:hypothetical protein
MIGVVALLILAWAGSARSNDAGSETRFDSLDRNGDGFVSRDEGRDAEELHTRFSELDANNDGKLSLDEYALLAHEARQAAAKNLKDPQARAQRSGAAGGSKKISLPETH